ncbi:hypothetical protein [Calditerrivibrio nitroreducens]|uniref:Uncharacterized protein n=1 Tax=Calditerrivibrio nitroreducens (strain DSM 19672 / NBRC 101217 / Yu37-1) TaxID=768670 RepID=E4THB4_CALNY|nr:hypothetical protein [Calditerrivibrio nitroreducens]ADR19849.1 hypothetical protein Calni_1949 [Calditerrivibrio nitroreducens DSM 19672]
MFIQRGYEQGGFEAWKFFKLLKEQRISSIERIGQILNNYKGDIRYNRSFAGSPFSPFYEDMKNGVYGIEGQKFFECVKNFQGQRGFKFWELLWYMLVCCNYLKNNYQGSFSYFLKKKYVKFKNKEMVSDDEFLKISSEEWEEFTSITKPWNELYGIGENVFDFIIGDIVEANFAKDTYKLDSANIHFLKVTGINKLISKLERNEVKKFLKELSLPYTIREINKGIYTYCSETEANGFGFCRKEEKCKECEVNTLCEKNF